MRHINPCFIYLLTCIHIKKLIRPLSGTSSFVKWHSVVHELFGFQWRLHMCQWVSSACLSVPTVPTSWIPLNFLETEEIYTYHYAYCVYNQLQNKNHRCQCKQMHRNYFRITTALCHLTAILPYYCVCWLIHSQQVCNDVRIHLQSTFVFANFCTVIPQHF